MQSDNQLIFVSGTGRSGTHLIGRTISSHKEIVGRIEMEETFDLITKIATTQDFKPKWQSHILRSRLKRRINRVLSSSKKHVLEKSHPSLWLVDFFIKNFDTKFVFVHREVEPTVSSMLEHKGVLSWYKVLPLNKPNRFLGITKKNADQFSEYTLEEKCALRWKSHYETIFELNKKYPKRTFIIKYDDFLIESSEILNDLSCFLDISNQFEIETVKNESLNKWKDKLNEEQLIKIRNIVSEG